jgi:putative ABC transport system permease protein
MSVTVFVSRFAAVLGVDARDAWRGLRSSPAFVAAVASILALGVGANLAIFAVVDRLLFRALPYRDPGTLVQVQLFATGIGHSIATAALPVEVTMALDAASTSFDGFAWDDGWIERARPAGAGSDETPLELTPVSPNMLDVLGIQPLLGSSFAPLDGRPGTEAPVLLTHAAWRTRFGGSSDVINRRLVSSRSSLRIAGVLPADFIVPSSLFRAERDGVVAFQRPFASGALAVAPVARLRPGTTVAQAQAEVDALIKQQSWQSPALRQESAAGRLRVSVVPLREGLVVVTGPYLWLASYAGWIVLAITCANVAILVLARARRRTAEHAIRAVLGCTRVRALRVAVLEALLLSFGAAAIAVGLHVLIAPGIVTSVPGLLRGFVYSMPDNRMIAVAIVAAVGTGVVAGAAGSWWTGRADLDAVTGALARSGRRARGRVGETFLTLQAAVGVLIMVGTLLSVPSFLEYLLRPPAMAVANLFTVTVNHGTGPTPAGRLREVLDAVRTMPAVESAAFAPSKPYEIPSEPAPFWTRHGLGGAELAASDGLFRTIGTPLRVGREFTSQDVDRVAPVALLNEAGARALWPGESFSAIVGRMVVADDGPHHVVGIVRDIRTHPGRPIVPTLFTPARVEPSSSISGVQLLVRKTADSGDLRALSRTLNSRFASGVSVKSVAAELAPGLERPRFLAILFGGLGTISLVLAAGGVFAVTSAEASMRRREIAVRLALGASRVNVVRQLANGVLGSALVGAAIGGIVSWFLAGQISQLFTPSLLNQPMSLGGALGVMLVTTIAAAWRPVARALRSDPAATLRQT